MSSPEVVADRWMFGGLSGSLVVVGPTDEIEVNFDQAPDLARLIGLFAAGATAETVSHASGLALAESERLMAALRDRGALVPSTAAGGSADVIPLHAALGAGAPGRTGRPELICTADELLIVPGDLDDSLRTLALRNFVAGLEPLGRLRAYAALMSGRGQICGDRPNDAQAVLAVAAADFGDPTVVRLHSGEVSVTSRAELVSGGFERAHRLGPLTQESVPQSLDGAGIHDVWYTIANLAESNLAHPTPPIDRRVQGTGDRDHSRLCARAEGAERYALRTVEPERIRVARAVDLDAVLRPEELIAFNERQLDSFDLRDDIGSAEPRPWCEARNSQGESRWVDASLVHLHLAEWPPLGGASVRRTSSSGVAAHSTVDDARESALAELVERDAFMWTWIQQVARERIDPNSVPAQAARWARALEHQGWITHWVNLTLESWPVILCCLVRAQGGLVVGTACKATPAAALVRATQEALVLALRFERTADTSTTPESVRGPGDHLRLHARRHWAEAQFLYSSERMVSLESLPSGLQMEPELAGMGIDVHYVDLSSERTAPFYVVRAFAPGLAPLTFGWDTEPLGTPILGRQRRASNGETVGLELDLSQKRMPLPHPFA